MVTLFCALLAIRVFSLPFFLNAKSPIFAAGFFEEPPELTKDCKDPKWPPFPNNQIVKLAKIRQRSKIFMSGMKIFIRNYLIISIVLMLLANSKFAITPSRFDALKKNFLLMIQVLFLCFIWYLCYVFDSTEYVFRGSEILKTRNFLTPRQPWCR